MIWDWLCKKLINTIVENSREDFVDLDRRIRMDPAKVHDNEILQLVKEYCLENGKEESITDALLLSCSPLIIKGIMLPYSLSYFENKYEICLLSYGDKVVNIF